MASTDDDETCLFLFESGEKRGNAIYVKDLRRPSASFVPMATDMDYSYAPVEVVDGKIYLLTNYGAPRYRLMVADLARRQWRTGASLSPRPDAVLASAQLIGGKLYLNYNKDVADHPCIYTLDGKKVQDVQLPSLGSVGFSGSKDGRRVLLQLLVLHRAGHGLSLLCRQQYLREVLRPQDRLRPRSLRHRASVLSQQGQHAHPHVPHLQERT